MTALLAFLACLPLALDVTKEDIKRLVTAGVSEPAIVAFIQAHAPASVLSPDDLMELREAGASEAVLRAMVEAAAPLPDYAPPPDFTYPWYYPYGYYADFFYGTGLWWYTRPGRWRYPYSNHWYRYPTYPYGYHWRPPEQRAHVHASPPRVIAPRPPVRSGGSPRGGKH